MRIVLAIALPFIFQAFLKGQEIQLLLNGTRPDSSFYQIEKIGANEFWIGGEYGILKKVDTLGNVSSLGLPNLGKDIIKIKKVDSFVYLLTADAVIYRYDLVQKSFLTKSFTGFKNKCFYDFVARQDGTLVVCGGATGIAEGKPKIPRGFIATVSPDLSEIKIVWKSLRKFVWALLEEEDQSILAVTFNGLNTKVMKSEDLKSWSKVARIKGLVHEINLIDDKIWFSGARSALFKKSGILGTIRDTFKKIKGTGCIWRLDKINDRIVGVTYSGDLIHIGTEGNVIGRFDIPKYYSLYDLEQMTASKMLVVGRGKTAFIVPLER